MDQLLLVGDYAGAEGGLRVLDFSELVLDK